MGCVLRGALKEKAGDVEVEQVRVWAVGQSVKMARAHKLLLAATSK